VVRGWNPRRKINKTRFVGAERVEWWRQGERRRPPFAKVGGYREKTVERKGSKTKGEAGEK
jgi:hypothetical protein